jgi:hypothetical protein
VERLSSLRSDVPEALSAVVDRGLRVRVDERFATALAMAEALVAAVPAASQAEVARWVTEHAAAAVDERRRRIAAIESTPTELADEDTGSADAPVALDAKERRNAVEAPTVPESFDIVDPGSPGGRDVASGSVDTTSAVRARVGLPRRTRTGRLAGMVILTTAAVAATSALVIRTRHSADRVGMAAAASASSTTPASVATPSSLAPPRPGDRATEGEAPASSSSAMASSSSVPASSSSGRTAPRAPAPLGAPSAKRTPRPPPDCNPPYEWDAARQIRVYKKECH